MANNQLLDATRDIAINFSFALPEGGPILAGVLSGLFDLFGSSGKGPNVLKAIQNMIDQAVDELKAYMDQCHLEKIAADTESFFDWYFRTLQKIDPVEVLDDPTIKEYERPGDIFEELEFAGAWQNGSLYSNLHQIFFDHYIQPDVWMPQDKDSIVPVLLFTVTALASAIKLRINLYRAAARHYAPHARGSCESLEADERYVRYTKRFAGAVRDLHPASPG